MMASRVGDPVGKSPSPQCLQRQKIVSTPPPQRSCYSSLEQAEYLGQIKREMLRGQRKRQRRTHVRVQLAFSVEITNRRTTIPRHQFFVRVRSRKRVSSIETRTRIRRRDAYLRSVSHY
ncbi:uncharacterized protein LOC143154083 [Ptiloglossa arizonensis]|uniref:uncharacterized protein LOC143154083 n=1 Tax=Ptiloglossa arizonensis TaxID=3350558 RepID=UPI003F9F0170